MKKINILKFIILTLVLFQFSCEKDEECKKLAYYQDIDGDGFGNPEKSIESCEAPQGYVDNNLDCDDENPQLNPNNPLPIWYKDADGDGYGNENEIIESCHQPEGYVANSLDCDDNNSEQNPDFPLLLWYQDLDSDGFGNNAISIESCTKPDGYVDNNLDCDDNNFNINPGVEEIPGNSIDENCDGLLGISATIGNKWYYEGHDYSRDPWNSSTKWTKHIEECIDTLIIDSILFYRVKGLKMKEGEDDIIYYQNYKLEIDPDDFEYSYTEILFNREVTLYENQEILMERYYDTYCGDFGYTKYRYTYEDEHVRVDNDYSLKGCIIDGVEYGNVSQL